MDGCEVVVRELFWAETESKQKPMHKALVAMGTLMQKEKMASLFFLTSVCKRPTNEINI